MILKSLSALFTAFLIISRDFIRIRSKTFSRVDLGCGKLEFPTVLWWVSQSTLVTYYVGGNFQHGALTLQIVTNIESLTLLLPVWRHVLLGLCDKVHSMRLKLSRFNCLPSLGWPIWSMVKFFICSRFLLIWMTLIKNCSPSCL